MTNPAYRTVPPGVEWLEASMLNVHLDEAAGLVVVEMEIRAENGTLEKIVACGLKQERAFKVARWLREKARDL